jgi:hypothetical protein
MTRRRTGIVGYAIAGVVAAGGLGAGLGLGFGLTGAPAQPVAAHHSGGAPDSVQAVGSVAGACGTYCVLLYSRRLGPTSTINALIPSDDGRGGQVGRKINVRRAASRTADGDFALSFAGRVWQLCGIDARNFFRPGSYVCDHDSNYWVFEAQWTPYGNSSGLCAGVSVPDKSGENITLRQCGVDDRTLWIADQANGRGGNCRGPDSSCPWMNASDNNFRHPQVLTLDRATWSPANQLRLSGEHLLPPGNKGGAWNNQEFTVIR